MLQPRIVHVVIGIVSLALALPQPTRGEVYIEATPSDCWCEGNPYQPGGVPHNFPVWRVANTPQDCDVSRVAFRIEGVTEGPNLTRSFVPFGTVTGDPFGQGAIIDGITGAPGNLILGMIRLQVTGEVPVQIWSVAAHLGLPGTTTPVAQFESAPGVWVGETGHTSRLSETPNCDACPNLPAIPCPFAVEPGNWSGIKGIYR